MKQKFYAELSRRLREEGIESSYAGTQNLNVSLHGQPVLCVTPSSEIYILPAGSKNEEYQQEARMRKSMTCTTEWGQQLTKFMNMWRRFRAPLFFAPVI